jgi:predicted RNA-binding protein
MFLKGKPMCEFNVLLNGKVQFKDVIYAKVEKGKVITKNVLGEAKIFDNCSIVEVDVNSAKMMLVSATAK